MVTNSNRNHGLISGWFKKQDWLARRSICPNPMDNICSYDSPIWVHLGGILLWRSLSEELSKVEK